MGRSWRDSGEEGEMGFWKEEKTKASDWGCLPIDGFSPGLFAGVGPM